MLKYAKTNSPRRYRNAMQSINQSINKIVGFARTCRKPDEVFDFLTRHAVPFSPIGGMTNQNILLDLPCGKFVLRLPHPARATLIDREHEAFNNDLAYRAGLNVETPVLDVRSGVKLTRYLENGAPLNQTQLQDGRCLRLIAGNLRRLHGGNFAFRNTFNAFDAFRRYFSLLQDKDLFLKADARMDRLADAFWRLEGVCRKLPLRPCHNDLVPENMLLQGEGLFFIDWEYSGMNDPLFDLAAVIEEGRMPSEAADCLLEAYFAGGASDGISARDAAARLNIHRFCQNVLWFLWTKVKEEQGEDFGGYAARRLAAAFELSEVLP